MQCPTCKHASYRVMRFALPAWLCGDGRCSTLHGFWSSLIIRLPFDGYFLAYDPDFLGYWRALLSWLIGDIGKEGDR